jgi:hypothetical protein
MNFFFTEIYDSIADVLLENSGPRTDYGETMVQYFVCTDTGGPKLMQHIDVKERENGYAY